MPYDPKKRDRSWTMIQPGCWIDPAGCGHIFPDEVLAHLQVTFPAAGFDPRSKRDYDLVVDVYLEEIRTIFPAVEFVEFIRHDREAEA